MKIIRVFPRRTSMTPKDDYAFVGWPGLPSFRPEADEVHISTVFTWDILRAIDLGRSWQRYYPLVRIGGPAFSDHCNGFQPGMYIREGITFTSRGCNNHCPWCLVPEREGRLKEIADFAEGNVIQDNNLLQCNDDHISKVFAMLRKQKAIQFSGGLEARLIKDWVADEIRSLRVKQIFLAADTDAAIKPLERAVKLLGISREKIRCYVLLAYKGESMSKGIERLEKAWYAGTIPFAQLYQPPDKHIAYSQEWHKLARTWSRPAATKALMRGK